MRERVGDRFQNHRAAIANAGGNLQKEKLKTFKSSDLVRN
jgi:hypothetical protein